MEIKDNIKILDLFLYVLRALFKQAITYQTVAGTMADTGLVLTFWWPGAETNGGPHLP